MPPRAVWKILPSGVVPYLGLPLLRPRPARVLADMADVEALRARGVPSLLSGPPGTGKTSLVEVAVRPTADSVRKARKCGFWLGV
jgi:nitric oxide reductase NorQ protein